MKNKIIIIKTFLLILSAFLVYFVVDNDAFIYREPVAKIVSIKTLQRESVEDTYKNTDEEVTQKINLKLLNQGKNELTVNNIVNQSQATGQIYRRGQKVILQKVNQQWQILSLKRDALIAGLLTLFVGALIFLTRLKSSLFLLASLLLNLIYFVIAILFNVQFSPPVLILFGALAILFAFSSLTFVIGWNRQMFYTFITTILTTAITFLLTLLVLRATGNSGVHFEYLEYVTQNPSQFFFVGTMISVLGAIMDGTGDIVAGLFGLARQNKINQINFGFSNYVKSGISIGQEIIGTLTNVLFMIFMAEAFPMTLLLLRNGNTWSYIATVGLNLGLLQTIISAIGIVLAVPITSFVASYGLISETRKEHL